MLEAESGVRKLFWMLERQRLASNSSTDIEKQVFDVNVLAIFLAKLHPGFEYVSNC
jgi:hypothetical protein